MSAGRSPPLARSFAQAGRQAGSSRRPQSARVPASKPFGFPCLSCTKAGFRGPTPTSLPSLRCLFSSPSSLVSSTSKLVVAGRFARGLGPSVESSWKLGTIGIDMGILARERAQKSVLMEVPKREYVCSGELQPEPQLPCGWEKCLNLKSGLIYFKDWNSETLTYRDPRQTVPLATQRIGLLSISLSAEGATSNASEGEGKKLKRMIPTAPCRLPWGYCTTSTTEGESSATETTTTTTTSVSAEEDESLELSLNLPGTSSRLVMRSSQEESVCTMEKVRSALERSNWLPTKHASASVDTGNALSDTRSAAPSLLSNSRESNSARLHPDSCASSPSTSQCSSQCFTSPSAMSYEGDDEEVQQQLRLRGRCSGAKRLQTPASSDGGAAGAAASSGAEVMVAVGCKSCLTYVMLSKSYPSCPRCGSTDVLLELPAPWPKKQRLTGVDGAIASPTWSWCTA